MNKRTPVLGLGLLVMLVLATTATAARGEREHGHGAVYTLTNSPFGNAVAAFDRSADGTLAPAGLVPTGGAGTGSNLGSQGAVVLTDDQLYAVNAGSNTISFFSVSRDGLRLEGTVPSGGSRPISVTVHEDVLYVLNAGGAGNITGFSTDDERLTPIAGSTQPLGTGSAGPAQVQFSPDGRVLVVSEKASNTLDTYVVGRNGRAGTPRVFASVGATPFGFDFDNRGNLLVSNASASASSYGVSKDGTLSVISGAVATHQGAPCWLVTSTNGRYAYTANASGGTISGFAVGRDGSLTLLDPSGATANLGTGSHPLDEAVSGNGRFLYNLTDGTHSITGLRIGEDGGLAPLGNIGGLPAGSVGLAAS